MSEEPLLHLRDCILRRASELGTISGWGTEDIRCMGFLVADACNFGSVNQAWGMTMINEMR